jgi:O-antigen/teichoic acid export membrane protein
MGKTCGGTPFCPRRTALVFAFALDETGNPVSIRHRIEICHMSRLKNFSRNLATSYLQLSVNVMYSLVSVPLILHWLPRAEFGMWAVLVQLMAYISLVDLGINQAIARFLVDHKDRRSEGEYGALIKTSALVSVAQGLIILIGVTLGSPLLATLMNIQKEYPEYQATFISLMRIQGVIAAFTFCMNPLQIMLNAHQRMDIISRQSIYNLTLSLGLLVLFLIRGCGIYSFVYAGAITAVITPAQLFWHCWRLGFVPRRDEWGNTSWPQFRQVFNYGKDLFFMNLGAQLITASQIIIVTRALGLEAAAAWSVGTKIYTLVKQILFQPYSAAIAGLSEMAARNETERLRLRFKNLVVVTASLGVFTGIAFALCNSLFVAVWTGGKIVWSPLNDVLLAVWLFGSALQCTHCNFVAITKQIGGMRYLYFVEGCCFVGLAQNVGYRWGVPGIIACSITCTFLFSYPYGLRRSRQFFHVSFFDLAVEWVRPSLKLAGVLVPVALIIWLATSSLPAIWRLVIHGFAVGVVGGIFFLRLGLPLEVVREAGLRLPRPAARILGLLVPCGI